MPQCRLGFFLFLLLTGVLFIRPAEIFPAIADLPIYQVVILLCLLSSTPLLLPQLSTRNLLAQPGAFCVAGLLAAVVLSHLIHGDLYGLRTDGLEFAKVLAYYFLLLGLINNPARLKIYLLTVVCLITVVAAASVLVYHEYLDLPALTPLQETESYDDITGDPRVTVRLMATGVFSDPNDFAIILLVAIVLAVYWVISNKGFFIRSIWTSVVLLLGYAFTLTRSRGGLLALLGSGIALLLQWLGPRRAVPVLAVVVPIILLIGGRQSSFNINDTNDTAQGRMELWRGAFHQLRLSPVFGIGTGKLADEIGQVAHNSYLQAYAEMGLFGGTLFFGAVALPIFVLRKQDHPSGLTLNSDLESLRIYIQCATIGYAVGFCSLTRCYVLPTYLVLGIAGAYSRLQAVYLPSLVPRLSWQLARNVFLAGIVFFFCFFFFVKFFGN